MEKEVSGWNGLWLDCFAAEWSRAKEKAGAASRKAHGSQVRLSFRSEIKYGSRKHVFTRKSKTKQIVSRPGQGVDAF